MRLESSVAVDLLTLKRSKYLDELRARVPEPRWAPCVSLARWRARPLDARMPGLPPELGSEAPLARRKLGEPLRLPRGHFDTGDPHGRQGPLGYEALHDPHLARFFRDSAPIRAVMIKAGLLTKKLDVTCNLKEYNDYRDYLRLMYGRAMREELQRRDEAHREELTLDLAHKQSLKAAERLRREEARARLREALELQRQLGLRELTAKWGRSGGRLASESKARARALQERAAATRARREIFERRRVAAARLEQQQALNARKRIYERQLRLASALRQAAEDRRDARLSQAANRFERKRREQEETIEREERLKRCAEELKQIYLEEYESKLAESRRKLQDLFIEKRQALEKSRTKKKKLKRKSTCCCKVD